MRIYAILGIALLLIGAVKWVEAGAVGRVEAGRLAKAIHVQQESLTNVRGLSQRANSRSRQKLSDAQARINELESREAAIPDVVPLDEFCQPGCAFERPWAPNTP